MKCIKRSKDKNGEDKIDLLVLFDFVRVEIFLLFCNLAINKEDPKWDLNEEIIGDLKEIFLMFDSDVDGVLTLDQVCQAIGVLGIRRSGWSLGSDIPCYSKVVSRGGNIGPGQGSV